MFAVRYSFCLFFFSCFSFYLSEIKIVHPTTVISLFHSYFLLARHKRLYSFQTTQTFKNENYVPSKFGYVYDSNNIIIDPTVISLLHYYNTVFVF